MPLVRKGSPYLPYEAPDRIRLTYLNTRIKDLAFVKHDVPIVDNGALTSTTPVKCDPNPNASTPASEYRTASDYSKGASPTKLRGIFAVALLSNGYVGVVDVDDWDAQCRRPFVANPTVSSNPELPNVDWRGCHDDPPDAATWTSRPYWFYDSSNARTTSDELSCNVVEPHHARSAHFMGNNTSLGVSAPSLQAAPILTSLSNTVSTSGSTSVTAQPKMLAVPFGNPAAGAATEYSELYVGSSHYFLDPSPDLGQTSKTAGYPPNASKLVVDPLTSTQNSLLLPQVEPRAYLPGENFAVTYEGRLFGDRPSGQLLASSLTLQDPDAYFCSQGVQDLDVAWQRAGDFINSADPSLSEKRPAFASAYADIVQVTSDFFDGDPYWATPVGSACAKDPQTGQAGIVACRSYFGTTSAFTSARDWQITEAYQNRLVFQPIADNFKDKDTDTAQAIANLHCCFPGTVTYTVRARNQWVFRGQQPTHNIVADTNSRCVLDKPSCQRKQYLRDRIIEISSSSGCDMTGTAACAIGPSTPADLACVVPNQRPIEPNRYTQPPSTDDDYALGLGPACVFDSLRARFAIYRGKGRTVRDMAYVWQVVGGFVPYELNLANRLTGSSILPQALISAPNLNALLVVDGVSGGVFELTLDPFGIVGDPYL